MILDNLLAQLRKIQAMLNIIKKRETLYQAAIAHLGLDASPRDGAPDELGCAESVSEIVKTVIPDFPVVTGTYTLWNVLRVHPRFRSVSIPMPGAIIISPTGTVKNAPYPGHVGICGMDDTIMSNTSANGKWEQNYTKVSWHNRWGRAGFPTYYYQLIV